MKKALQQKQESRSARRARFLQEGCSWREACLRSGYSKSAANRGPKSYFQSSPGVRREYARLLEDEPYPAEHARRIAKNRLTKAVLEGKSSNVAREIELLGRLREHDWWARASDVQVGIFAQLCDPEMGRILDEAEKAIAAYRDDDIPSDTPKDPAEKQGE